jgi:branched-chain amino acid transport system ATP-binding protein
VSVSTLSLQDVHAAYDGIIVALRGVSLEVPSGAIVALLGGNGAGKTTTLKTAAGLLAAERGALTAGRVQYQGRDIAGLSARHLVQAGLALVLEGRHVFPHFSVEDNLIAGTLVRRPSQRQLKNQLESVYQRFPRLKERRRSLAGFTSGGEQQMLAIGRALMSEPKLVLLDEPSMGLAPLMVEEIFEIMKALNAEQGIGFLLAEQNATLALRYSDFGYVLENGQVAIHGKSSELAARDDVRDLYLGAARGSSTAQSNGSSRSRRLASRQALTSLPIVT